IDVMLVLLIIFMITAPLLTQGVKVDLPKAGAEPLEAQRLQPLVLSVDREGRLYLNIGGDPQAALDEDTVAARATAALRRNPDAPRAGAATGAGRGGRRAPRRRAEGGGTAGRSGEAGRGAAQGRGARRAKTCRRGTAEAGGSAGEQRERGGPAAQSRGGGACQGRALDSRAGELGDADRPEDH